jgi:hypothetical protein
LSIRNKLAYYQEKYEKSACQVLALNMNEERFVPMVRPFSKVAPINIIARTGT